MQLRTLESHLEQCNLLEDDESEEDHSMEFGINSRSKLMSLEYFDLCSGCLVPDILHDVLEGALQYEAKLLLKHCILSQKHFTLDHLNQLIDTFELGYMESNRPSQITSKTLHSQDNSLKQNGTCSYIHVYVYLVVCTN